MKNYSAIIGLLLAISFSNINYCYAETDWSKFALLQANGYWDLKVFDINENFDVVSDGKGDAYLKVMPPILWNDTLRYELQRTIIGMGTSKGNFIYMSNDTLYITGGAYPIQFPFYSPGAIGPSIPKTTFIMFADFGSDSWESYYQEIENYPLKYNVIFNGSYTFINKIILSIIY